MSKLLKSIYKRLPFRSTLQRWENERKSNREITEWENAGKPFPPPHTVKQRTILGLAKKYSIRTLVETGTYLGDMVEAMKGSFDRVYSIELSAELHQKATERFAGSKNVEIIQGDSGIELEKLMTRLNQPTLFWLDGHYSAGITAKGEQETPIYSELTHIFNSKEKGHVILVDDARCFGADPAYPTLDSLSKFVRSNVQNVMIELKHDSIHIVPQDLNRMSAA